MDLNKLILEKNECYISGLSAGKLVPKGIMVHSTAASNTKLSRYVGPDDGRLGKNPNNNHWNHPHPAFASGWKNIGPHPFVSDSSGNCRTCGGRRICCHAFIGKLENGAVATYQTLPWDMRGWHGGGSCNNTHIGFEICEDDRKDPVYLRRVFREAVELCAHLCRLFGLTEKDIVDHAEGYKRGIASNHSDVSHWFPLHGESMNSLRAAVRRELEGTGIVVPPPPLWIPAVGDLVRFKDGHTTYFPGGPTLPAFAKTGDPHMITKIESGGKQVVYGGSNCVLLGKRVNPETGRESAGVNTWAAVDFLMLAQGADAATANEDEAA